MCTTSTYRAPFAKSFFGPNIRGFQTICLHMFWFFHHSSFVNFFTIQANMTSETILIYRSAKQSHCENLTRSDISLVHEPTYCKNHTTKQRINYSFSVANSTRKSQNQTTTIEKNEKNEKNEKTIDTRWRRLISPTARCRLIDNNGTQSTI